MEIGERRLRTGIKAVTARRDHDRADHDAEIEPASDLEVLVQREDHPDRGAKELVVAEPRLLSAFVVALANAEQAIHVPADLAAAAQKRFAPLHRIVVPF